MIEAKKIKKIVKGKTIIDSIDLKFSDSGFYCLSGDNGAGKSTLLGILGLLDSSYEGELIINSLNCKKMNSIARAKYRSKHIAFLLPHNSLFGNLTIKENIDYFYKGNNYPLVNGMDLNQKASSVSGGEEQLIAISRSIKMDQDIFLLDEVTSFLDDDNTSTVMSVLKDISQRKLIIIASHDQRVFPYIDFVYYLSKGKLI